MLIPTTDHKPNVKKHGYIVICGELPLLCRDDHL